MTSENFYFLSTGRKYQNKEYSFPYALIPRNSTIAIWGAGNVGKAYYEQVRKNKYADVAIWVDKNWQNMKDKRIVSPTELANKKIEYIVIAIKNEKIAKEIMELIGDMDMGNVNVVWQYSEKMKNARI